MHIEEKELNVRLELRCAFPDDYEGDADGLAWAAELPALQSAILAAVVQTVQRHGGWKVRPGNRGRPVEDEVMLILEKTFNT
jgi:hypothetical protein